MSNSSPITVLGAGSWGTALAMQLARHAQPVRLWDINSAHIQAMQQSHSNERYLPGIRFPDNLECVEDLQTALAGVQDVLCVVPSHAFRAVLNNCKDLFADNVRLVWATKGIDPKTCDLLSDVAKEVLGDIPLAVLSGPSFAKEVAEDLPTAVVIAANNQQFSQDLVQRFHQSNFRVYTSDDLIGVQVGGALKNVFAIAAGASDGLGFGTNARCALITRGLAEMVRLGLAMGAQQQTFMGLSGLGDLVLTCTDNQSRNRRFGLALGEGKTVEQAEKAIDQVIEGKTTAEQAATLAQRFKVSMPIAEQVQAAIDGQHSPRDAFKNLLGRDQGAEF